MDGQEGEANLTESGMGSGTRPEGFSVKEDERVLLVLGFWEKNRFRYEMRG